MGKPSYCQELVCNLHIFQQTGYLCDIALITYDGMLMAHSAVLSAASPILKDKVDRVKSFPQKQQQIKLPGIPLYMAKIAIKFAYTGNLVVPQQYTAPSIIANLIGVLAKLGLKVYECVFRFVTANDHIRLASNTSVQIRPVTSLRKRRVTAV